MLKKNKKITSSKYEFFLNENISLILYFFNVIKIKNWLLLNVLKDGKREKV